MAQVFINNFRTAVASTFGIADPYLQVTDASGLPELTGGDFYRLTLFNLSGVVESGWEVVTVTARTGNQLTVTRTGETGAPAVFLAGTVVEARASASTFNTFETKAVVAALTTTVNGKADAAAMATALSLKADITSVTAQLNAIISAAPGALDTLNELAAALGNDANFANTVTAALALKAPLANPTFTGTVGGITKAHVGLGNADNTADTAKPVSTAQQTALNAKLALTGGTLTGPVVVGDQLLTRALLKDCGYPTLDKGSSGTTAQVYDFPAGDMQRSQATGAHSVSFTNWPPTGNLGTLIIKAVNFGAYTITWPTINWMKQDGTFTIIFSSSGVTLQTSGTDFIALWTDDGGATIYGKVAR